MRLPWIVAGVMLAVGLASASSLLSDETAVTKEDGFTLLFPEPGVPRGWMVRAWDDVAKPAPDGAKWRVDADGVLHGSEPRGTWLVSQQEYGDFELAFEFKLPPQGNSGCGLRFPAGGDPRSTGWNYRCVTRAITATTLPAPTS